MYRDISSKLTDYRSLSFCLSMHGFVCFKMDKFNNSTKINFQFSERKRKIKNSSSPNVKRKELNLFK